MLEELGVGPGDQLELREHEDGYLLRPRRIRPEKLGTLGHLIPDDYPPFDIAKFREEGYDWSLRD